MRCNLQIIYQYSRVLNNHLLQDYCEKLYISFLNCTFHQSQTLSGIIKIIYIIVKDNLHIQKSQIDKQINDKERCLTVLENQYLMNFINLLLD
ncbi:unnamed protein product [Paramecium sonneborni]|uniref:Uncharacterized protein n=1 Tax=Paramecium sonneborni TaxID=65129 RepID=A0A8S1L1Q1_9CILI|nr:unnamed protein product [Paramecium sonneborni]